jgi:hypothetical protein
MTFMNYIIKNIGKHFHSIKYAVDDVLGFGAV